MARDYKHHVCACVICLCSSAPGNSLEECRGYIQVGKVCTNTLSVDFSAEAFSLPCGIFWQRFMQGDQKKGSEEKNLTTQEMESKIRRIKLTKKEQEVFYWEGETKHTNTKEKILWNTEEIWILMQIGSKIAANVRMLIPKKKSLILAE